MDPGLRNTGYGVIDTENGKYAAVEGGVVSTAADASLEERLLTIYRDIRSVISEHSPEAMAIEDLYTRYPNVKTAIVMGHARGVVCMGAAEAGIPVFHYQPTRAKNFVTGSGRAGKQQVQRAVAAHLEEPGAARNEHVADAFAIAICHAMVVGSKAGAAAEAGRRRGRRSSGVGKA